MDRTVALNESRRWLVAYDIREPRRLARVHRLLGRVAVPVQYSVFAASGSHADMRRLADELRGLIDESVDDVRIYSIPTNAFVYSIGRTLLPEDAWLLDGKTDLGALLTNDRRGTRCQPAANSVSCAGGRESDKGAAKCPPRKENSTRSA
jgi:CRISPR-associated protein Cas2